MWWSASTACLRLGATEEGADESMIRCVVGWNTRVFPRVSWPLFHSNRIAMIAQEGAIQESTFAEFETGAICMDRRDSTARKDCWFAITKYKYTADKD